MEQPGDWAEDGEPVMPNFPTGPQNTFLGLKSYRPAYYARVVELDLSLDNLLQQLVKYYPGLPESMLSEYLMQTALVAATIPLDTVVHLYADCNKAEIAVRGTEQLYTLWTEQPIPRELS